MKKRLREKELKSKLGPDAYALLQWSRREIRQRRARNVAYLEWAYRTVLSGARRHA